MKPNNRIISSLAFIVLITSNCTKKASPPIDQLPPATHTGASTFGCLINSKSFVANVPVFTFNPQPILKCTYYGPVNTYGSLSYFFRLEANDRRGTNDSYMTIGNDSLLAPLYQGATINLGSTISSEMGFADYMNPKVVTDTLSNWFFNTQSPRYAGQLTITYMDTAILSGTFWFNAINTRGDTIAVRDGRFDAKY